MVEKFLAICGVIACLIVPAYALQGSQTDTPPPRTLRSGDGREVRLIGFDVVDEWSPSKDETCQAPPADYQVARIHLQISYSRRPLTRPTTVELVDILDRRYAEQCQTHQRSPTVIRRNSAETPAEPPLPVVLDFTYSIPIRPRTPIKRLIVDDVVYDEPASRPAPN